MIATAVMYTFKHLGSFLAVYSLACNAALTSPHTLSATSFDQLELPLDANLPRRHLKGSNRAAGKKRRRMVPGSNNPRPSGNSRPSQRGSVLGKAFMKLLNKNKGDEEDREEEQGVGEDPEEQPFKMVLAGLLDWLVALIALD